MRSSLSDGGWRTDETALVLGSPGSRNFPWYCTRQKLLNRNHCPRGRPPLWPLALRPGQVAFSHDALMVLAGTPLQRPKSVGDRPVQRTSGDDPSAEKYSIARSRSAPLCGPELLFRRSSSLRGAWDAGIDAPVVTNDAPPQQGCASPHANLKGSMCDITRHGKELRVTDANLPNASLVHVGAPRCTLTTHLD
jgi:hypothetical protein